MSKRSNSIVAVTIAKYATVFVEADTPDEAAEIARDNIGTIYEKMMHDLDDQFEESIVCVDSYEAYTSKVDDYMDYIWCDGKPVPYDEYIEELEEEE